jgi:hypothetical protein
MNDQTHKLKMYENLVAVMIQHLEVWKPVAELSAGFDSFVRNYKKLNDLIAEAEKPIDTLVQKHADKQQKLADLLLPVVDVVLVYLKDIGNKAQRKTLKRRAAKIGQMKGGKISKLAASILDLGNRDMEKEHPPDLSMYGLTEEIIGEIQQTAMEYSEVESEFKAVLNQKKKAIRGIRKLISRNDLLLDSRLDVMIRLFEASHPDFYNDYIRARRI